MNQGTKSCRPDSTGADWFKCSHGTIGCPRIHDGRTPHCIACTAGTPCGFQHDPPVLEQSEGRLQSKEGYSCQVERSAATRTSASRSARAAQATTIDR